MMQTVIKRAYLQRFSALRMTLGKRFSSTGDVKTNTMTWPEFFQLRKKERIYNTVSSGISALAFVNGSWIYLSTLEIDPTQSIFGFDPIIVISGAMITCGGIGWLLGPVLGTTIFKAASGAKLPQYQQRQLDFLSKIKRNRVNPQSQSFSNPVPDYYGEKINSIQQYRQWLRDCHAYKRKASEFL